MTMASTPMARMFMAVSRRVSPFTREEAVVLMETTSAPSFLAEISKAVRVRVLGSRKRFTTVRPRIRSSPLPGARAGRKRSAWRKRNSISARESSSMPVRSFFVQDSCLAMLGRCVAPTKLGPLGKCGGGGGWQEGKGAAELRRGVQCKGAKRPTACANVLKLLGRDATGSGDYWVLPSQHEIEKASWLDGMPS